jgi:1-deoxy-D-xylulose-5-phosphate synthase
MLHIVTRKGKGYDIAEADPIVWHGASKFDPDKPIAPEKGYGWSNAFGDAAIELAKHDRRVWVITPAMRIGSGLDEFSKVYPERYLDVGIAEDVAVTTAAGLALQGEKPIVAIYSTFLQRGFDQVIHDVAIENLDVTFAIDRAGLVGGDGMTHQGVYDISFLRAIPNLSVAMPKDADELQAMLKAGQQQPGPKAIRWPRGGVKAATKRSLAEWSDITWGSWEVLKEGRDAYVLAIGPTIAYALEATRDLAAVGVINARFVKPLDTQMLLDIANEVKGLVTVEDHQLAGGLGSAVLETLATHQVKLPVIRLGIAEVHVPHGDPEAQHAELGYGVKGIRQALVRLNVADALSKESTLV